MVRVYLFLQLAFIFLSVSCQQSPLPSGCYESNYTSTYTRCDLSFITCYSRRILQSCHLRKCQRYIRAGDCFLQTSFVLDQEACYRRCCGSTVFDENQCDTYNVASEEKKQSSQTIFIIVMSLIAGLLLIFAIWFSIKVLRCCDKSELSKIVKYNVKWRKDEYIDCKCDICHLFGPMMITPCQHYFHVSCFEEATKDMVCPKCQQEIKDRVKIYCFSCRQSSFKVRVWKTEQLTDAIEESKGLHYDLCPKQIRSDRKLLESGEHL